MAEQLLVGLTGIVVLGIGAQWLAWRLKLPAILLLLLCGFAAGPALGLLQPDLIFGDLLFPLVSLAVAIILFEGGLSLRFAELRQVGRVVWNLVTVGVLVTWLMAAAGIYLLSDLPAEMAILLGAILVVSGPTVIVPLLRQVRPVGKVGAVAKWEGIVNDPIGAILAVLVFEVIVAGSAATGSTIIVAGAARALVFGGLLGLSGAALIVLLLRRYLIPDFLHNPIVLMIVIAGYVLANTLQAEAGLLAVTVMGVALANQRFVSIKQITEFKETLRVLFISTLFIILAARLSLAELNIGDLTGWLLVGFLIVVVRPVVVWLATWRSALQWRERIFLAWLAPRGIVAAAMASIFVLRLDELGIAAGEELVPLTFKVIIGTVVVYGLTAPLIARRLKIAHPNPQGLLLVGAHPWAAEIGRTVQEEGFPTVLVDANWENVTRARRSGCRASYANILAEDLTYDIQLDGIGRLLALTPNDEVNSLAGLHFADLFGRAHVYQLAPPNSGADPVAATPRHLRSRFLYGEKATYQYLTSRFQAGALIKKTSLTTEFEYTDWRNMYGDSALILFVINQSGGLTVQTIDDPLSPQPGQTIISLVDPPPPPPHPPAEETRLVGG